MILCATESLENLLKRKKKKKRYFKKLYGIVKKWPKKIKLQILTEPGHGENRPLLFYTLFFIFFIYNHGSLLEFWFY